MSNMIRMIYVSQTTNPVKTGAGIQTDIGRILMQARKNNSAKRIGGVLYFRDNHFFQCLEGEQKAVNELYSKISEDPRHKNVQTVSVKRIDERLFSNWSMKYVANEDRVSRLLQENGYRSFTPYEFDDAMLDKMLKLFVRSNDPTGQADQSYKRRVRNAPKSGFFQRVFG
jgi:hypothetical protein